MLSHAKDHESLTGKLLLSTALVAVTFGFGWWQQGVMRQQQAAVMAAMMAASAPQAPAQTQAMSAAPQAMTPDASAPAPADAPQDNSAPSNQMAMASPQNSAPQSAAAAPTANAQPQAGQLGAAPQQTALLPASPPPVSQPMQLTGMDAIRAFLPTEGVSPPLPVVTGTPDPGASPPIPAGTRLEDGDYTSDRVQFEWGDLRARIIVTGGKITGVQIVSYPDHRSQSLYLIQLADPILTTEVIKTQQARVNTVSSATNSSIAFRDAIAGAIIKATR